MTKEELLKLAKPILFNTDMVKAILEGRKTVTRRCVKPQPQGYFEVNEDPLYIYDTDFQQGRIYPPCKPGDILYVRETWHQYEKRVGKGESCHMATFYGYKASIANSEDAHESWKPSIHMPKEAARIFLKVKNVRVERLQSITDEQALNEGVPDDTDYPISKVYCPICHGEGLVGALSASLGYMEVDCTVCNTAIKRFKHLWNSTIDKKQIDTYGWDANPYVWVIEFEKL